MPPNQLPCMGRQAAAAGCFLRGSRPKPLLPPPTFDPRTWAALWAHDASWFYNMGCMTGLLFVPRPPRALSALVTHCALVPWCARTRLPGLAAASGACWQAHACRALRSWPRLGWYHFTCLSAWAMGSMSLFF